MEAMRAFPGAISGSGNPQTFPDIDSFIQSTLMRSIHGQLGKGRGKGLSRMPPHRRRELRYHRHTNRRSVEHHNRDQLLRVRPHETGGPCIIKRTLQLFLHERLDGDSAARIFEFLGPGCNFQLHVTNDLTFDKALQEMNRLTTTTFYGLCCGIWLCSGMHRARTRLKCPVSILGPTTSPGSARIMAADWTIASEYVALKSVQVVPPPCLRSNVFHTLMKVAAGNVVAKDCHFEAVQRVDAGPSEGETHGSFCLKVHKAAKVCLHQCRFHAARRTAVDVRCPQVTVSNCTFLDCSSSIDCGLNAPLQRMYSERPRVRILGTRFENSQTSPGRPAVVVRKQFAVATVKDCVFQNVTDAIATNCTSQILANRITAAGNVAIWVNGAGHDEVETSPSPEVSEISGNRLEKCGTGILATHLPQVIVKDNEAENMSDVAIHLRHVGHHETAASRVECNTVRNGHGPAAVLVVKSSVDVLSNTLHQPGRRGLVLEGRGAGDAMPEFHLRDNQITGARSSGIEIIGKSRLWNEATPEPPDALEALEPLQREEAEALSEGRPRSECSTIAHNSISCCGRGVVVKDVPAILEGNSLAKNNGWAIHLDLRFGGHQHSSALLQNTVVVPSEIETKRHRTLRLSMPEPGCSSFPGIWPQIQENLLGDDILQPMVKRRKVED